jgi:hypothetical protein
MRPHRICLYAVKSGPLNLWQNCGAAATRKLDGTDLCQHHYNQLEFVYDTCDKNKKWVPCG